MRLKWSRVEQEVRIHDVRLHMHPPEAPADRAILASLGELRSAASAAHSTSVPASRSVSPAKPAAASGMASTGAAGMQ